MQQSYILMDRRVKKV
nr:unnamed protein product [Callosobruchus analis]